MIESHLLQIDPLTGARLVFHYDHADDQFHIEEQFDLQNHIDFTKELFKESNTNWKGDLHHVASIPAPIMKDLAKKGIMTAAGRILDKVALKKWLNDPDNRAFRTRPGNI